MKAKLTNQRFYIEILEKVADIKSSTTIMVSFTDLEPNRKGKNIQ